MRPNERSFRIRALLIAALPLLLLYGCGSSESTVRQQPILEGEAVRTEPVTVTLLDALNSPDDDFGATMPIDSTVIFFTTSRGETDEHEIFESRNSGGVWQTPMRAVELNNGSSNGTPSVTPGGEALYFTGDEYGFGDCDLYRVDEGPRGNVPEQQIPWSIPTNLGPGVNSSYWDSQPCIAADGTRLFFSSDRPGGIGGRDIWVCDRASDGSWESPINAGPILNTSFDEITPWYAPDGQTVLFSSNGHPGLGGFDVFMAIEVGGRTTVKHMGIPINSSSDDICFSLSTDGHRAFLSSNRSGGKGGYDIYQVSAVPFQIDPLMTVRGVIYGSDGKPMIAKIDVTDLYNTQSLGSFTTDPETGLYTVVLPRGYNYALTAQAPGYLFSSEQLLVQKGLERDATTRIDFRLQPINGTVRLLVFFKPNESNLQRESMNDLNRAVDFLRTNEGINIEIAGHADNSGDATAARELSRERAQAVKSYLVGNRILADRIKVVGYGSSQPIAENNSDEGRALNRRVEMRVLGDK